MHHSDHNAPATIILSTDSETAPCRLTCKHIHSLECARFLIVRQDQVAMGPDWMASNRVPPSGRAVMLPGLESEKLHPTTAEELMLPKWLLTLRVIFDQAVTVEHMEFSVSGYY